MWAPAQSVPGFCAVGLAFILEAETLTGAPVHTLSWPATIMIAYEAGDLPTHGSEDRFVLYRRDVDGEAWLKLPSLVDTETRRLTALTERLGQLTAQVRCQLANLPLFFK